MDLTAINRDFRHYTLLAGDPNQFAPLSHWTRLSECGGCPWGVVQQLHGLTVVDAEPEAFDGQIYATEDGTLVYFDYFTDEFTLDSPAFPTE